MLAWRDGALDAGEACFTQSEARLCARGAAEPGAARWTLRVDGRSIPVAVLGSYWRDDLDYGGRFDLRGELGADGGPVTGRLQLETGPGRLIGTLANETTTLLDYGNGRADLRLGPEAVRVEARLPLAGDGLVALRARVDRAAPRALSGRIEARVTELGLVTLLAPAVGRVDGRLLADIELGGSLDTPSLAGSARLEGGRLSLLPLGIELSDLEADIGTDDGAVRVDARAGSGGGRLQAELRLARADDGDWAGSGTITGTEFEALALPEARVVVSPALDWRVDGRSVTVEGDVAVPTARIEPRDLSGSVRASPDAVIVGREASQQPTVPGWEVRADVAVTLGPEVHIDAFGLEGRLGGEIRIQERPGQLTTASGELRVEQGRYTIYRQTLEIERGRVIFGGGPLADPGLDVRAVRRPRDVLVGVNVRGTLRAPRVELFSEPPMSESQQLSYLIVGMPLGETSGGEQSTVAAAAAALARSRPGSQLAGELGIDEVTVDQDTPGEGASVVLGRYLSPRLYVGYGIGLMEQADSVRMRYELGEHWTLEARSGVTSSADLLYSIEVDSSIDAIPLGPGGEDAGTAGDGDE
ncbi:MAG: translocation/assembly module TamB domain-containing protein [Halofilum sp. (in: g-proteobacteria)]|nr:translocation/assembly module TamB domain-containing protein [Halofilum sp. (in: g-proteobacteria)]